MAKFPLTMALGKLLIYGGFSWRANAFRVWTIYYETKTQTFRARIADNFHPGLTQAAFIGDWAKKIRAEITLKLNSTESGRRAEFEPLQVLAGILRNAGASDSIGGSPQLVRIGPHLNTRPLCVLWGEERHPTLFGRSLFEYENAIIGSSIPSLAKSRNLALLIDEANRKW